MTLPTNTVAGYRRLLVKRLDSVAGLVRWADYIPVTFAGAVDTPAEKAGVPQGGVLASEFEGEGDAWVDYIPVFAEIGVDTVVLYGVEAAPPGPPENATLPALSGATVVGGTSYASTGTWSGTGTVVFTYQWKRAGSSISGATSASYVLQVADYGQDITCTVTATTAYGSASATSEAFAADGYQPTFSASPTISGTPQVSEVLTCTAGTTTAVPAATTTYQWRRNSVNIAGATASTYTVQEGDIGGYLSCSVTATNVYGAAQSPSANSLEAYGFAPTNLAAPVVSGTASVGYTLTSTTGEWSASPGTVYTYQWKRAGSNISGATASTYVVTLDDIGSTLTCTVTATNAQGTASATSSATSTVPAYGHVALNTTNGAYLTRTAQVNYNAAYTVAFLAQVTADTGDYMLLSYRRNADSYDGLGFDPDLLPRLESYGPTTDIQLGATPIVIGQTYHFAVVRESASSLKLYVNGALVATCANNVGTSRAAATEWLGRIWTGPSGYVCPCKVAARKEWSRALTASEVADEATSLAVVGTSGLVASYPFSGTSLAGALTPASGGTWTSNGTATLDTTPPYIEVVELTGGGDPGETPPANTSAPVITGTTALGNTLSVSTGTWSGTGPITYTYQWKRAGSNISGATASTYVAVAADVGATITCTVTATNAYGNASATSAAAASGATGSWERPFTADSPWNTLIGSGAVFEGAGDAATATFRSLPGGFVINSSVWSIPVYEASAGDPDRTVNVNAGSTYTNTPVTIKMPAGAVPSPDGDGNDRPIAVVSPDKTTVHEFWNVDSSGGTWTAVSYTPVPVATSTGTRLVEGFGPGEGYYQVEGQRGWGAIRAYGGSNIGGLIRTGELAGGINHAIAVAFNRNYMTSPWVEPIASRDDWWESYPNNADPAQGSANGVIKCGQVFSIPPSVDLSSMGLGTKEYNFLRAVQLYGIIIVDMTDNVGAYMEQTHASEVSGFNTSAVASVLATYACRVSNVAADRMNPKGGVA